MIKSFRDKDTQALFEGRCPRRWLAIRRVAERKLIQLKAAATLDFLRAPPGNRLEALKGDRAGQYSIRGRTSGTFMQSVPGVIKYKMRLLAVGGRLGRP